MYSGLTDTFQHTAHAGRWTPVHILLLKMETGGGSSGNTELEENPHAVRAPRSRPSVPPCSCLHSERPFPLKNSVLVVLCLKDELTCVR